MVTNRPSHNVKGIDLCGLDGNIPDSSGSLMRGIKREQLKFKGWIDIEQVELFNGASGKDREMCDIYSILNSLCVDYRSSELLLVARKSPDSGQHIHCIII